MKGGEPETEDVGAGSRKMSFYTLDRLLAINSIDPRRTIKHSAFKCNIVIVDSLDNLVGEYLLKCGDSRHPYYPQPQIQEGQSNCLLQGN